MKAKPLKILVGRYVPCPVEEATHVKIHFPGPSGELVLPVIRHGTRDGTPNWTWNGSTDKPTLRPSVRTQGADYLCHSWVSEGQAQFLPDSTHEHAGKTRDLLEVE